eukprot:gene3295-4127_t
MAKRQTVIGTPFWMAPEVIQEVGYDYKADIWSFGITCIEMAESKPPLFNVHPMRVIFMIPNPSRPPPKLAEPEKWSSEFNDFLAKCLTRKPELRPSAEELLKHPFIARAKNHSLIVPLIDEQDMIIAEKGRDVALGIEPKEEEVDEEDSDDSGNNSDRGTVRPLKPRSLANSDDGGEEEGEFDSGTMVITDNNQSYDTMVFNNNNDDGNENDTGTMKPIKPKFVPAYMDQFKKDENKYKDHSLDQLKKLLEELEIEREKEIAEIKEKYAVHRQSICAVIEEKKLLS